MRCSRGGAPLLAERLALRGGPSPDLHDPLTFLDTSGNGPGAIAAIAAIGALGGRRQLVYGSDRPVVEPRSTQAVPDAVTLKRNGAALLAARGVPRWA